MQVGEADGNCWPSVLSFVAAVLWMGIAGQFAIDDPPEHARQSVVALIECYEPLNPWAKKELVNVLRSRDWTFSDLVEFAITERRQERLIRG